MAPFFLSALKQNLGRLGAIRAILLAVECSAVYYAHTLGLSLAYITLSNILLIELAVIIFTAWRAHSSTPWLVTQVEFLAHLLVDAALLFVLLYLTGGASNPLVSLLLIPLTISAALLPARYTCVVTVFSLMSYTALLYYYVPVDLLSTHHAPKGISPHLAGMWFTFVLSALLITYFVTQMARALRRQERHLQQNREDTLRDEQVLAVATLVASAAHELGTPLSTMRVLLAELETETSNDRALNDDVKLLQAQVDRCKVSLQNMVRTAQDHTAAEMEVVQVKEFIARLLDNWHSVCPVVKVTERIAGNIQATQIQNTPSLTQALMNLLNNASKVSQKIDIEVRRERNDLCIVIGDYGPGISQELLQSAGRSVLPDSSQGMGIGLLLTHATIERVGGSVKVESPSGGGSLVTVYIPLYLG